METRGSINLSARTTWHQLDQGPMTATIISTTIARELVGFMWAIDREVGSTWRIETGITHSRAGGGGTTRGNARQMLCGRGTADARSKIGTVPDAHRECGIQSAHQSLITNVHQVSPFPGRDHQFAIAHCRACIRTAKTLTAVIRACVEPGDSFQS